MLHILTYFIDWPFWSAAHSEGVKLAHALCHIGPHQFYFSPRHYWSRLCHDFTRSAEWRRCSIPRTAEQFHHHLCCRVGKRILQQLQKALPHPEDHNRELSYCTFDYTSYSSQPSEHCTSKRRKKKFPRANRRPPVFLLVWLKCWGPLPAVLQYLHMISAKPHVADGGPLQYCLVSAFNMLKKHTPK